MSEDEEIKKNFYLCIYVDWEKQNFQEFHFGIFCRDVSFCGFVFFTIA